MKKKLGISIIIGVVILSVIIGVVSIVYASLNNIYAANTYEGFSFALVNGKPKEYVGEYAFKLTKNYTFDMEIPKGASKSSIKFSEESGLLEINGQSIIAKKMGKGTLKATIKISGKEYETSTKFEVIDTDLRFALDKGSQKEYIGENAFVVNGEYSFEEMKFPDGFSKSDLVLSVNGNKNLLEIVGQKVVAKKAGSGEIVATVGTGEAQRSVSTRFEVVNNESDKKTNNNNDKNTSNTQDQKNTNKKVSISFVKDEVSTPYVKNGSYTFSIKKTGVSNNELAWSSSDTSVATVDKNGKVAIKGIGTTTVTVTHNDSGTTASSVLNVYQKELVIIDKNDNSKVTGKEIKLKIGDTSSLELQDDKGTTKNSDIKWASSKEKVCTVDADGNIKGITKGKATITGTNTKNSKSVGRIVVEVLDTSEEVENKKLLSGKFSFPIDQDTGKTKEYKGGDVFVVGEEYEFELIRPEGTEGYPVEYSTNNEELLKIVGESVYPQKVGSSTIIAKIKIGSTYKVAKTRYTIVATKEEKEAAKAVKGEYMHISFEQDSMVVQKDKTITLKPLIETNLGSKDYTVEWTSSVNGAVEFSNTSSTAKTNKITPKQTGNVDVEVKIKGKINTSAKIRLEVKEEVVTVKSLKINNIDATKSGTVYKLTTNEVYKPEVTVLPETATSKDYILEVDDNDNFMIVGNTVIAINPGHKTKLRVLSTDDTRKTGHAVTIESVGTTTDVSALPEISDKKEIIVALDETVQFKTLSSLAKYTNKNTKIASVEYDEEVVTVTGKNIGESVVLSSYDNNQEPISVKVLANEEVSLQEGVIMPTQLSFVKDPNTGKIKDYVDDYPFEVGKHYSVTVNFYPSNATYRDIQFTVNNSAFSVTSDNKIVANEPNKTATLTATLKNNPNIKASIKIGSTAGTISNIAFVESKYVLDINKYLDYDFNLIITLSNGTVYNPVSKDLSNNTDYQKLLKKIDIYTSSNKYINIVNNKAYVVKGVNGSGTLNAVVQSDNSIKASTKFETIGVTEDVTIRSVKFARKTYDLTEDGRMDFLPIITLSNGEVLDPSLDYDDPNGIATTSQYKNYLSQLELAKIEGDNKNLTSTGKLVLVESGGFSIDIKYEGLCALGIKYKNSNEIIAKTNLNIKFSQAGNNGDDVEAIIDPIDPSTNTSDKSLKITKARFDKTNYKLTGNFAYGFNPVITLSDGTQMSVDSTNKDVYEYYCDALELYYVNATNSSEIDLGILSINNNIIPRKVTPLKNGSMVLAIGRKNDNITLGTVPVTVELP